VPEHDEAKPPRSPDLERPEATAGMSRKEQYEMLKRFRIVGLCLVAVFALSAVVASSASAFPAWEECTTTAKTLEFKNPGCSETPGTEWGWEELITTKASTSEGTLALTAEGTTVTCNGTDGGTIGPGSQDEITKATATNCSCGTTPVSAEPTNLPWKTKLYETNGEIRDKIENGGKGEPGWKSRCGIFSVTCTGETSTAIKNKANGTVDAIFDTKSAPSAPCGPLGGRGTVRGTDTIKSAGTKAIRVTKKP
jgi:hypothetical protein